MDLYAQSGTRNSGGVGVSGSIKTTPGNPLFKSRPQARTQAEQLVARTWTDSTGKHKIVETMVNQQYGVVEIRRQDRRVIKIQV